MIRSSREQVRMLDNVVWGFFLYKMNEKWLKIADFRTFDNIYQFQPLEIEKIDQYISRHITSYKKIADDTHIVPTSFCGF